MRWPWKQHSTSGSFTVAEQRVLLSRLSIWIEIPMIISCKSTFFFLLLFISGLHSYGSERSASFGTSLFQDKTVNELKLRFVKTWWVRWASFISLPTIRCRCRTSWLKYREVWKSTASHRLESRVNSLDEQDEIVIIIHTKRHTHILSSSQFTHCCLTLSASAHLLLLHPLQGSPSKLKAIVAHHASHHTLIHRAEFLCECA